MQSPPISRSRPSTPGPPALRGSLGALLVFGLLMVGSLLWRLQGLDRALTAVLAAVLAAMAWMLVAAQRRLAEQDLQPEDRVAEQRDPVPTIRTSGDAPLLATTADGSGLHASAARSGPEVLRVVEDAAPSPFDPEMARRHPLRVLLAEDHPVNQKVALAMLRKLGYEADVAVNGREALSALERRRYDVVLMDVHMPEMDGLEATRALRARWPEGQRPRIIAVTADASEEARRTCAEAGMEDHVSKPVRASALAAALRRTPASPSPVEPAASALDRRVLDELRGLGVLEDVLSLFLSSAPELMASLEKSLAQGAGEAQAVERAAHTLKGIAGYVGAREVAGTAAALELRARTGQLDQAPSLLAKLRSQLDVTVEGIRPHLTAKAS